MVRRKVLVADESILYIFDLIQQPTFLVLEYHRRFEMKLINADGSARAYSY